MLRMCNVSLLPGRSTQTLSMPKTCLIHKVQIKNSTRSFFIFSFLGLKKPRLYSHLLQQISFKQCIGKVTGE